MNTNNDIRDAFSFDYKTLKARPKVEIRAGYLDNPESDVDALKSKLVLNYTGSPTFVSDDKTRGGRNLEVRLSDISTSTSTSRITTTIQTGASLIGAIQQLTSPLGINIDIEELSLDATLASAKFENTVFYNSRQILTDILPSLTKQYPFGFYTDPNGTLKFVSKVNKTTSNASQPENLISSLTGMIEHPVGVTWVHWQVKTFYGRPRIFKPGEWARVQSRFFADSKQGVPVSDSSTENFIDGLIIEAKYQWKDSNAVIDYKLSAEGQPVTGYQVLSQF